MKLFQEILGGFAGWTALQDVKDLGAVDGIVLIDEIEAHLHPTWQAKIVPLLKRFFPKAKLIVFESAAAQLLAVRTGRAQALQMDTPITDYFASQGKDMFEVLPELLTASQNNAIYLKQGDFTWWQWLDTSVGELRSGSWYPQYNDIYKKWFGKDAPPQKFYLK